MTMASFIVNGNDGKGGNRAPPLATFSVSWKKGHRQIFGVQGPLISLDPPVYLPAIH
jgi:hypothetical protein